MYNNSKEIHRVAMNFVNEISNLSTLYQKMKEAEMRRMIFQKTRMITAGQCRDMCVHLKI